jgi:hypothetical protein
LSDVRHGILIIGGCIGGAITRDAVRRDASVKRLERRGIAIASSPVSRRRIRGGQQMAAE